MLPAEEFSLYFFLLFRRFSPNSIAAAAMNFHRHEKNSPSFIKKRES